MMGSMSLVEFMLDVINRTSSLPRTDPATSGGCKEKDEMDHSTCQFFFCLFLQR
jgi:hypothetical protein